MSISETSNTPNVDAVRGEHTGAGVGVHAVSASGRALVAESDSDFAVRAHSKTRPGVRGSSGSSRGVEGSAKSAEGVVGDSETAAGVFGISRDGNGVHEKSVSGSGIFGESERFEGVTGIAHDKNHGAIVGKHFGGGLAGFFDGDVQVTKSLAVFGDLRLTGPKANVEVPGNLVVHGDVQLTGADYAEDFDLNAAAGTVEAGTVMVLDEIGGVRVSDGDYDTRVAGIVSGAGDYKPAIVLDRRDTNSPRLPLALMGKVFCKVDATRGPISIGDILTTSSVPGHAMKAADRERAFGAVIGKALAGLKTGRGLIPVLVALQ